jgi:hypothetical protein
MKSRWTLLPLTLSLSLTQSCGPSATPAGAETPAPAQTPHTEGAAAAPDAHASHVHATPGADPEPAQPRALLAEEQRAYEAAKPVFERYCTSCHTSSGAKSRKSTLEHLNMDAYPFGGHHAHEIGALIRRTLGAGGEKATMPKDKPGAVRGEEIALIVAWTEAFDRSHAAGLHRHGHEGHGSGH